MTLSIALNTALSGLNINKRALDEIAQNIANANTKDYSRKIVDLSSVYLDGVGSGVQIDDVTRKVDIYLSRSIQLQSASMGMRETYADYADRIQVLLGQPGANNSIDTFITKFFSSLQTLAETPERGSLKLSAVNSGVQLARNISQLANDLYDLRAEADTEIAQGIARVNKDLSDLYTLNQAISDAYNNGKSTAELLDKRDALMRDVASYLDISYYFTESGEARINTNTGTTLLDSARYQLQYSKMNSLQGFVQEAPLAPIYVYVTDEAGNYKPNPQVLATGGTGTEVTSLLQSGKFKALMDLRDSKIPSVLAQLDNLAATVRDTINAVHNAGSGYPGANSYTGTRLVNGYDSSEWSGKARITLLGSDGQPVSSVYSGEEGLLPLTLDFSTLDSGDGNGRPTVQTIIDEINSHYYMPQNKASLGDINNIRMRSDSTSIPGGTNSFKFDFDLENISGNDAQFFVTNVTVLDDTGADITSVSDTMPQFALAGTNTFVTTAGSNVVRINTAAPHNLNNGDYVYLPNPGGPVDGIPASQFAGIFQISNVSASGFDIQVITQATAGGNTNVASLVGRPNYMVSETGEILRTRDNGMITASLLGNPTSVFYTVRVATSVVNSDGSVTSGTIDYQVTNQQSATLNDFYSAQAVSGSAQLRTPGANAPLLTAKLVDAKGVEIAKDNNGDYLSGADGYLKLQAANSNYFISMDALDSKQLGFPSASTPVEGTNRSFSHFFELNNFFSSNDPTDTGDTTLRSALRMSVQQRLVTDPNLITTGTLTQTATPVGSTVPRYTYERYVGDNGLIQQLAALGSSRVTFAAAGGLGTTSTDFNGYAGEMLGYVAADANTTAADKASAKTLLDGFNERLAAVSGVNLDEELANTVIYQNAYSASARVITVTNQLFDVLLNTFQT